jgi:transaldolase
MTPTRALSELGQSLWLDHITRDLLESGTLQRYTRELSVTGLTSNPTILECAIARTAAYDAEIGRLARAGQSGEDVALLDQVIELRLHVIPGLGSGVPGSVAIKPALRRSEPVQERIDFHSG